MILLGSQHPCTLPFRRSLLLVAFVERYSAGMVPADVIEILDFVDANDPILAGVSFFERAELWPFSWQTRSSNPILRLPRREKGIEIVVGHFVPKSRSCQHTKKC